VHVYPLGAEPGDDLHATTSAAERVAMVWPLTLEAWELSGRDLPRYSREQVPVSLRPMGASGAERPGR
jgi:hypothetical protein